MRAITSAATDAAAVIALLRGAYENTARIPLSSSAA